MDESLEVRPGFAACREACVGTGDLAEIQNSAFDVTVRAWSPAIWPPRQNSPIKGESAA